MPSRRDHKGRFSKTHYAEKIETLVQNRKLVKCRNLNASFASKTDHPYALSFDDKDTEDDFDVHLPADLVPLSHCRFVVELDTLSAQLKSCRKCNCPLYLHEAQGVRPYGLTGIVYIVCSNSACGALNRLKLGKVHHENEKRGVGIFDVNTKAAAGLWYECFPCN